LHPSSSGSVVPQNRLLQKPCEVRVILQHAAVQLRLLLQLLQPCCRCWCRPTTTSLCNIPSQDLLLQEAHKSRVVLQHTAVHLLLLLCCW
jgi:hypothetical protein